MRKIITAFDSKDYIEAYLKVLKNDIHIDSSLLSSPVNDHILEKLIMLKDNYRDEELLMKIDRITYLPDDILVKIDRASMHYSLETRVPFLDSKIVNFSNDLPMNMKVNKGKNKRILRSLLSRYCPENITEERKKGFNVPIDKWLRGRLKDWANDTLNSEEFRNSSYFNSRDVLSRWDQFISHKNNNYRVLWSILIFQSWLSQQ